MIRNKKGEWSWKLAGLIILFIFLIGMIWYFLIQKDMLKQGIASLLNFLRYRA
jgi:hypothetical protein